MNADDFLARVIDDGLAAARADYTRPDQADQLRGAVDGFDLCRRLGPLDLRDLLTAVNQDAMRRLQAPDYWYWHCRASEVDWVCNVLSAVLERLGIEPIAAHLPTARGVLEAARIVGVAS